MEIEVGEYGRTNLGKIIKFAWLESIEGERYKNKVILIKNNKIVNELYYFSKNEKIVKHSKNIIKLIEKDDYINGEKVIDIFNPKFLSLGELPYIMTENNKYEEQDIETILTKEQMASIEYKVEEVLIIEE